MANEIMGIIKTIGHTIITITVAAMGTVIHIHVEFSRILAITKVTTIGIIGIIEIITTITTTTVATVIITIKTKGMITVIIINPDLVISHNQGIKITNK